MHLWKGHQIGGGCTDPNPSTEIIKNLNPNEENGEIPNIDVLNNPNLPFHSRIPVLRSRIPIFQKGQIPGPDLPFHDSLGFANQLKMRDRQTSLIIKQDPR